MSLYARNSCAIFLIARISTGIKGESAAKSTGDFD